MYTYPSIYHNYPTPFARLHTQRGHVVLFLLYYYTADIDYLAAQSVASPDYL